MGCGMSLASVSDAKKCEGGGSAVLCSATLAGSNIGMGGVGNEGLVVLRVVLFVVLLVGRWRTWHGDGNSRSDTADRNRSRNRLT